MAGWRYLASRLSGNGTETFVHRNVPLSGAQIADDLSGPGAISGSIPASIAGERDRRGQPIFQPWGTAIYAELDGKIMGAGIIAPPMVDNGASLDLSCVGFSGYAGGLPYVGHWPPQVQIDPLDAARRIWYHLQSEPGGNIGLTLDGTTSPVRIGTETKDDGQPGPYVLAEWETQDLGQEFDDLAQNTPFEYRTTHEWGTGEKVLHHMEIGYPSLGTRLDGADGPRFVVGENVFTQPAIDAGNDYASEALILGAGEGRAMVRGRGFGTRTRLRRVAVIQDDGITSQSIADQVAGREARWRSGALDFAEEIVVTHHPHAPFGSFQVGDEIFVQAGPQAWSGGLSVWCRILSITYDPEKNTAALSVIRSEKVAP